MTRDVVIRHCDVRVVRHGGWSWGPAPRRLVDRIVRDLPQLITHHLDGLDIPDGDVELTSPVRIAIRIPARGLQGPGPLTAPPRHGDPASRLISAPRPPQPAVSQPPQPAGLQPPPAGRAGPAALLPPQPTGPPPSPAPASPAGPPPSPAGKADPATPLPSPPAHSRPTQQRRVGPPALPGLADSAVQRLLRYLLRLHHRGELSSLLALLPSAALQLWYQTLSPAAAPGGSQSASGPARGAMTGGLDIDALLKASDDRALVGPVRALFAPTSQAQPDAPADADHPPAGSGLGTASADDPDRYVRRRPHRRPREGQIRDGLQALAQLAANAGADAPHQPSDPAHPAPPGAGPEPVPRQQTGPADIDIESALPFLLLGPLHRIGYLDAIPAALDAAGLADSSYLLAAALAGAVHGSAARDPRRLAPDQATAAFAGVPEPISEAAMVNFARRAGPALAILDAVLAQSLTAGHTPGQPLLLTAAPVRNGGGLVVADREGMFPILWIDRPDQAVDAWRASSCPLILTGSSAATPQALAALAAAGIRFIVNVPPTHQERWRRLTPHRLWTNDETSPVQQLASQALRMPDAIERLDEVVRHLAGAWSARPLVADSPLARGMTLATAVALGTIAWTLWKDRESPDPLLALERFGDLSARVRIEADRVQVRLPLGRRSADLREHGFLTTIPHVPWLAGRFVEFTGG